MTRGFGLGLLLWALAASPALAQAPLPRARCPAIEGGSAALASRAPEDRAAFLLAETRSARAQSETWSAVYATGYLGLAAGQLALGVALDDEERLIDYQIGAATSMIGVASMLILPPAILLQQPSVETLAPAAADGDCLALARAERVLIEGAASEAFGTSWLMHVGSALFNIATGLYMGLRHDHWVSGAISVVIGIAVGELQIWTRPTPLTGALRAYRAGEF